MDSIVAGIELFQKGGIVMYALLACSLFVVATGVERWGYFRRADAGRAFADAFSAAAERGDWEAARELAQQTPGALPALLAKAITRIADGTEGTHGIAAFLEVQSGLVLARLRARLYYLSVIVTMAPLLGLLGTISGMISAFSVFNVQSAQASAITGASVRRSSRPRSASASPSLRSSCMRTSRSASTASSRIWKPAARSSKNTRHSKRDTFARLSIRFFILCGQKKLPQPSCGCGSFS